MLSLVLILTALFVVSATIFYVYQKRDYDVLEIDGLLSSEECDDLIEYSKNKGLSDSVVLSNNLENETYLDTKNRTSKTLWIKDSEHKVAMIVAKLSEKLSGYPINTQESLQIAHYDVNGKFNAHYDACVSTSQEYCDKINRNAGQRLATLLIYLNDDFEGGETVFTKIGKVVKPKKGKGILFWNTTTDEQIIPESIHRGNPVIKGEKWICTKWSHPRRYPA